VPFALKKMEFVKGYKSKKPSTKVESFSLV
jgi:hypothetical protein